LKRFDCIGIGLATLDYVSLVASFPKPGLKLEAVDCVVDGGGPVATAMATLAKLGHSCSFVGKLGRDPQGELVLRSFLRDNVDTKSIIIDDMCHTPTAIVLVEQKSGRRTVLLTRNRSARLTKMHINRELIGKSRSVLMDGRDLRVCNEAVRLARSLDVATFLDVGSIRNRVDSLFPYIDHLVVAQEYALGFTGRRSPKKAISDLWRKKMKSLVITMGQRGAIGFDGSEFCEQTSFKVKTKDTTGAGDAYHGAYIHAVLANYSLARALKFAAAVAALNCRELGGRKGLPTLTEATKLAFKGAAR
jgi:sulfofructose kinase